MKRRNYIYLISIILLATSIMAAFLIITDKKISLERKEAYESLVGEVIGTAQLRMRDSLKDAEIAKNNFLKYENNTKEDLFVNLAKHKENIQKDYKHVYLITDDYIAYSSTETFEWENKEIFNEDVSFYMVDGITYISFVQKLVNFSVEDVNFIYYIHCIPFSVVSHYFEPILIEDTFYICLLGEEGEILLELNDHLGDNLYDYLRETSNKNSTIDKIITRIENNEEFCKKVEVNDESSYMVFKKLNDWDLVVIAPITFLYSDYASYTYVVTTFIVVLITLIIASSFILFNTVVRYNKDKEEYKQQSVLNVQLQEAVSAANKASMAKSNFLSRISHDIRTPMNGIIGMTHIAKTNIDDIEKVSSCLDKIDIASSHLLTLLNNVLDLSKIESGVVKLKNTPTNINNLLNSCEEMVITQSQQMLLDIETEFNLIHEFMFIDEVRLRQILINILSNAIKFNNNGGKIKFKAIENVLDQNKSEYTFIVEDTGIGMSKEFISKIYEPFSQEDEGDARTKYKGSGLGMSIVKELVELMDGSIDIVSENNKGTVITIKLEAEYLKDEEELNAKLGEYDRLEGMKVLLVEDNEINMEIAEEFLKEVGIVITKAVNGKEAVEVFESSKEYSFDAILMDVLMPVMDGYQATSLIRKLNREDSKNIPIIAMTANAYNEDREKALEASMDDHVAKPIQIERLYDVLLNYRK